jgi:hypothetical protein
MKFISILTIDPAAHPHTSPTPETMERMGKLIGDMRAEGALIDTGGRSPDMLELFVSRKNGRTTVTDGPYTESKEVVGGYALFDAKDRTEALAWTKRFLEVLGEGTCHVHEVSPTPP